MGESKMITKEDISYRVSGYGFTALIPKGSRVIPATNLPQGGYWVEPWQGMSDEAESWERNYGFHVTEDEVINQTTED
jgi:hypothetical protein